jgi:hypothetical protein
MPLPTHPTFHYASTPTTQRHCYISTISFVYNKVVISFCSNHDHSPTGHSYFTYNHFFALHPALSHLPAPHVACSHTPRTHNAQQYKSVAFFSDFKYPYSIAILAQQTSIVSTICPNFQTILRLIPHSPLRKLNVSH